MPRVSDEHLAARRQQILAAARRCFLRSGFHATSMQDVIAEADLSVGAVYRYFKSKHEIVSAIAGETVGGINTALAEIAEHRPPYPLFESMERVLAVIDAQTGPDGMFRLALQVWAETVRDATLAEMVANKYSMLRETFNLIARQARDAGELPPDVDTDAVGSVLFGMIPGYALQKVLVGQPNRETYLTGVQALLTPRAP
nr:TetR/AcrR family transcriptional regulator [Micromonospora sp. DSM 115978]